MKYEKPILEVIVFETQNVIRTSLTGDGPGDGGEYEGDWGN